MRKIKFRAWFEGHMYEVAKLDFWGCPEQATCDMAGTGENGEWKELFDIYVGEVELMQYTGLKDKNGVEIYEGDIIDVGTRIPFLNKIQKDEETNYLKLVPIDERWTESYFTSFEDKSRFEILGNIYENPELLEVE